MKTIKTIFQVVGFILGSWILVHVLGLFGVFLAAAYPVWWLISPEKTKCFACQGSAGGKCRFCGENTHSPGSPKNLKSAILNGALILVLSAVSTGLVFAENFLLHHFGLVQTQKTVSFVIPREGQYRLEEVFPLRIDIIGIEVPVNAVQADIGFDPSRLEVIEVSTADSFAEIFIQKEINNEGGYVRLTGGLPDPGFFADRGLFGTVFFRAKTPGLTEVQFLPSSLVLANDGNGTNVIKELANASYLILPDKLSSDELKQQEALLNSPVLTGEEKEVNAQLTFYAEDDSLLAWTDRELAGEAPRSRVLGEVTTRKTNRFLELVNAVDDVIISFWKRVGEVLGEIF